MAELVAISNLALWAAVLLLGGLVYSLSRQVGALLDRIAPAGALMVNPVLKAGDAAPQITAAELNGGELTLGGAPETGHWAKSTLIFFLAPDCPVCQTLLPALKSIAKSEAWLAVVLASDGGDFAEHQAYAAKQGLGGFPYVLSEALGRAYGVGKLPYAVLIDENGRIASFGLVNSREHLESLFEAKERNLASIQDYVQGLQQHTNNGFHEVKAEETQP